MDTVTGPEMALAMAKMGGIGVLHRNQSIGEQIAALNWVRRNIHSGGMIDSPITFGPEERFSDLQQRVHKHGYPFTSFPIVDGEDGCLLGMITRDEISFIEDGNPLLRDVMKPREQLITTLSDVKSEEAYGLMKFHKVKKLPVVDGKNDRLVGMYVWSDVKQDARKRAQFSLDDEGHFLVAAAVGCGSKEEEARAHALIDAGARVIVIDSSHGACHDARSLLWDIKERHKQRVQVIVGNVASYASASYLLDRQRCGDASDMPLQVPETFLPDAIKVGIGPGSICTTRRVTGTGVAQMTAVYEVHRAVRDRGVPIPIIADGGVRSSGDMCKCFAVGASAVMVGSMLAGTTESPGRVVKRGAKLYKTYRGMGSRSAMAERSGSRVRYGRQDAREHAGETLTMAQRRKMVPEGVEGLVEMKGSVEDILHALMGGIGGGLAHAGAKTISEFQTKSAVWHQSAAGAVEGRPHDVLEATE